MYFKIKYIKVCKKYLIQQSTRLCDCVQVLGLTGGPPLADAVARLEEPAEADKGHSGRRVSPPALPDQNTEVGVEGLGLEDLSQVPRGHQRLEAAGRQSLTWQPAGGQLVHQSAERKYVALLGLHRVGFLSFQDLGCHFRGVILEVREIGGVIEEGDFHSPLKEYILRRQSPMDDVLGVEVGEGVDCLPEDAELVVVVQSVAHQMTVQVLSSDGARDDGEEWRLHTGAHVEDDVLVSDEGESPDLPKPGPELLVVLRTVCVDHDLAVPSAMVNDRGRTACDQIAELQLAVFYPEVPKSQVHLLEGVGAGQGVGVV